MKQKEPIPRGFVENLWYEKLASIMRRDPQRFRLFSPATKYALSVYLEMKERHERQAQRAA